MARRAMTITALFAALLLAIAPAASAESPAIVDADSPVVVDEDDCTEPLSPNGKVAKTTLIHVPAFSAIVLPAVTNVQKHGEAHAGKNEAAATNVRKAFLKAKKAFHEARMEICSIKKGDEKPVKDVPSFFDGEA